MNIKDSFHCRWQHFLLSHYAITSDGQQIKKLGGIHSGKRCFIVGNGPSLSAGDLDVLKAHGEISFGFNRIFHIFDQTEWRPTYYIAQDDKMLKGCQQEVSKIVAKSKFIPVQFKWYNEIQIDGATYFNFINNETDGKPAFSSDVSQFVVNSKTVAFSAIQMAVYMGIRDIYLIGVDHHFHTSINSKGEIVVDPSAKDYFSEKYNADKDNLYIPNTDLSTLTFIAAREYADAHGIKIYNATRGGKLEVFPRVKFEQLFSN